MRKRALVGLACGLALLLLNSCGSSLPDITGGGGGDTPGGGDTSAKAFVLGAADFNTVGASPTGNSTSMAPFNVFYDGTHFFATDTNQSRILMWNTLPTSNNVPADLVIGQTSFSGTHNSHAANGLATPFGAWVVGTKLFVADTNNKRVMVWNNLPTTNGQAADFMLGNGSLTTSGTITASQTGVGEPWSVTSDGTHLVVADLGNSRVLIWNTIPTADNTPADVVVGQSNFTNTGCVNPPTMSSLCEPEDAKILNGKLVVADTTNARVMIWNTIPTSPGAAADVVIGQPVATSRVHGLSQTQMTAPQGVGTDGTKLYVSESDNSRILIWNTFPTGVGQPADAVFGQKDFGYKDATQCTASNLVSPWNIQVTSSMIFIPDGGNQRVIGLPLPLTTNPNSGSFVLGQSSFTVAGPGTSATFSSMNTPYAPMYDGKHLFVVDGNFNRVQIWNTLPTANNTAADVIVGQPDSTTITGGHTSTKLNNPQGVYSDGTNLFVADTANHRIAAYTSLPTSPNTAMNFALSSSGDINSAGTTPPTQSSVGQPTSVSGDGVRLMITDLVSNRVLIWNTTPTSSASLPDVVVGQNNFTTGNTGCTNPPTAATLCEPNDARIYKNRLVVADSQNNRVLIYNTVPTGPGASADIVLGQSDKISFSSGDSQSKMHYPQGLASDGTRLFVGDNYNNRVLVWNTWPTSDGQLPDAVIGQASWTANAIATAEYAFINPLQMWYSSGLFFMPDGSAGVQVLAGTLPHYP